MSTASVKASPNFVLPGIIALISIATIVYGFVSDSTLIGLGSVLLVTAIIAALATYGSATSLMEVTKVPVEQPAVVAKPESEFFPKGAIAFFLAMIAFFGATWLGLYGLMIYRGSNL